MNQAGGSREAVQADSNTGDYALPLRADDGTHVWIDVTAEDGIATERYVIDIYVASNVAREWRVYDDLPLDLLLDDARLPTHYVAGVWAGEIDGESRVYVSTRRQDPP